MCMKGLSSPINFIDHKEAVLFTGNALSDRIQFGCYRSIRVGKVCVYFCAHIFCSDKQHSCFNTKLYFWKLSVSFTQRRF